MMKMVTSPYPELVGALVLRGGWRWACGSLENGQPNATRLGGAAVHPHRILKAPVRPGWRRTREHGGRHRCSELSQTHMVHRHHGCWKSRGPSPDAKIPTDQSFLRLFSQVWMFCLRAPDLLLRKVESHIFHTAACRSWPPWSSSAGPSKGGPAQRKQKVEECGGGTRDRPGSTTDTHLTTSLLSVSSDVLPTP